MTSRTLGCSDNRNPRGLELDSGTRTSRTNSRSRNRRKIKPDYTIRYPKNWDEIALENKRLTGGICCYPGCQKAAYSTHHAMYADEKGLITGREEHGIHLFPLCRWHHPDHRLGDREHPHSAHYSGNWIQHRSDPVRGNRNTLSYYLLLRKGWKEKRVRV